MRENVLHITNLVKKFGGRTVVHVDEATFGHHGIEGLIGPNGAGKTTLINLITHKLTATEGRVEFCQGSEKTELTNKTFDQIARLGFVRTNQIIQDFESLTIMDSLLLAVTPPEEEKFFKISRNKAFTQEMLDEIQWYLDYFGVENPHRHALSAGEKKLLDIIRCMLLKPRFLLMDEPTAGLPQDQTDKVIALMRRKSREEGMTILIVEHDLDLIWNVCEHVFFMSEGQIVIQGSPDEVRRNETVITKYMGESHAER